MSIISPIFEFELPSPATKAKDLGAELLAFGLSVEQVLAQFDYNGADPDLVLSRVAILEAWRASIAGQVEALDQQANYRSGTRAQRLATTKRPGMLWQETDQQRQLWSIDPNGAWRLHSGEVTTPAAAWSSSSAPFYGRTATFTIPTVLDSSETIQLDKAGASSGFDFFEISTVNRNPTNTTVTVRLARFNNAGTTAFAFAWSILTGAVA